MVTRVLVELMLFLTPFAVFLIYRAASRDLKIRDRWPLTRLVIIGAVIAAAALIITPLLEPRESDVCFTATRYEADGKVTPSTEIPCEQQKLPGSDATPAPASPAPVAPRDTGGG